MYYIYVLKCTDNSLYTGITTDVKRRIAEHVSKAGQGAKYTRSHPPVSVQAVWSTEGRAAASKLEYFIKSLTRTKKDELIKCPSLLSDKYSEKLSDCKFTYESEYVCNIK